ncbi:MAG: hypothetical protein ACTH6S_11685 [Mesonia sp.]|uniref:hypothetical protein n=1 Tax=Mesonia sp. TaxID=1960830 RepID=UPI003F9C8608
MKTIHTSSLNEIKSVFNSESDNEQYFKVLKNSNSAKLYNVELAQPIVRKTKASVIWKSETNLDLVKISQIEEKKRLEIGSVIENFFKLFERRIKRFKGIPEDFTNKVMEIPDWDSILVNESEGYIVIVNWGFLNDKFNRREGLIKTIFPVPNQSVLVHFQNEEKQPIIDHELIVVTTSGELNDLTDTRGYARFGTLTRGKEFEVYELDSKGLKNFLKKFVCDGSSEYLIEKKEKVEITVIVNSKTKNRVQNEDFYVDTNHLNGECFNTKKLGSFVLKHPIGEGSFIVKDSNKKIILSENLPKKDTTYIIELNKEEETPPVKDDIEENTENCLKLVFLNGFDKPLKGLRVLLSYESKQNSFTTNEQGEIAINGIKEDQINYYFSRHKQVWEDCILVDTENEKHYIKSKPNYPWFWWLFILLLLILIWCCVFGSCFCEDETITHQQTTEQNKTLIKEQEVKQKNILSINCNTETKSGGYGVTQTKHIMGAKPGKVLIKYNMDNIPDKLEVLYEGKVLTSTFEVYKNENGYVGEIMESGGKGSLSFDYQPINEESVTVVVTGPNEKTSWSYIISCPN